MCQVSTRSNEPFFCAWGNVDYLNLTYTQLLDLFIDYRGAWDNVDYLNLTYTQILDLFINYRGAWGNVGYLNLTYTQIWDLFVDYLTLACRHIPSTICCLHNLFKY